MRFQVCSPSDLISGADLPWELPLKEWSADFLVDMPRGISRNTVRFAERNGVVYAVKELPDRLAAREYRLLRELQEHNLPAVQPVALITERGQRPGEMMALIITRFLEFALPYRMILSGKRLPIDQDRLLDAMVNLLVRLHLAGFHWGDCSLSNTLFRRDAGRLAAYMVDAETGERHPQLSDGQRKYDLIVAEENVAGELMDVAAEIGLPPGIDPIETANNLVARYERLWDEITRDTVFGRDEQFRIAAYINRLNHLGFDVEELEMRTTDNGTRLTMRPKVVEEGHHRRRLHELTGLVAQENQSRQILNEIHRYRAWLNETEKRELSPAVAAHRWLIEVYKTTLLAIPDEHADKLEGPELFHQIMEHRWFLSEAAKADVGTEEALRDYISHILPDVARERLTAKVEPTKQATGADETAMPTANTDDEGAPPQVQPGENADTEQADG